MALDGSVLARAKESLSEKRQRYEQRLEERTRKVYAQCPRVQEIDEQLRGTMADLLRAVFDPEHFDIDDIRKRNLELQHDRSVLCAELKLPDGYFDEYMCENCRDAGFCGTEICRCLMELYKSEQKQSLSSLLKMGNETFELFKLDYYGEAQQFMEAVYEVCFDYAHNFWEKSINLFFNGEPGLGKTFLSACIARVVAENGFSVVYDTAISIFSKFEDAKFSKSEDAESTRAEIRRYLECDLLILDDLGTEMTTAFTISALYEIINTRLVTNKKTIVSSNLEIDDLRRRYSGPVISRLEGEYKKLTFYGEDIRKQRNM